MDIKIGAVIFVLAIPIFYLLMFYFTNSFTKAWFNRLLPAPKSLGRFKFTFEYRKYFLENFNDIFKAGVYLIITIGLAFSIINKFILLGSFPSGEFLNIFVLTVSMVEFVSNLTSLYLRTKQWKK